MTQLRSCRYGPKSPNNLHPFVQTSLPTVYTDGIRQIRTRRTPRRSRNETEISHAFTKGTDYILLFLKKARVMQFIYIKPI